MWAQLIGMNVRPGREHDLPHMFEQLAAIEQPGSGLLRTTLLQDQKDPSRAYVLVVFESEEQARAREQDPRRAEGLKAMQAVMADLFEGPPEFTDMTVLRELIP